MTTAIRRAADIINAGERVAILIGQGARTAAAQVQRVADITGAGVAKALLGKDVLSDELPYVTGSIGLLGTRPSYELMRDCDTLLIVGSNFPYSQFLPKYDAARAVQIDIDGSAIGMRYPTELNIVADAASALDTLIPLLQERQDRSWRTTVEKNVSDWWETLERQSMLVAKSANPMRIVWELSQRLPNNAIVTADSGSSTNWYARCLRFTDGVRGSVSGTLATMGCAVPYAIGAKFAHPDRPVIALVGDGAMQMNGMAELLTIRRFCAQWKDPRLIVCVFHNNDLNQVTWELRAMGGAPKFEPSQSLPDVSYADVADAMGIPGIAIDHDDDIGAAWDRALAADGPTVLDIRCDPEMPPIPPHATYEQIKELTTAILKGDPSGYRYRLRTGRKLVAHPGSGQRERLGEYVAPIGVVEAARRRQPREFHAESRPGSGDGDTMCAHPMTDRIADPWGSRTPYGPGASWPARVDSYLAGELSPDEVDRWVQSAAVLHSNGDAMDIAVKDGRIAGVRGRAVDRVNRGRLDIKDLFGWQANASADRLTTPFLRAGGRLVATDWDTAMDAVVQHSRRLLTRAWPGLDRLLHIRATVLGGVLHAGSHRPRRHRHQSRGRQYTAVYLHGGRGAQGIVWVRRPTRFLH